MHLTWYRSYGYLFEKQSSSVILTFTYHQVASCLLIKMCTLENLEGRGVTPRSCKQGLGGALLRFLASAWTASKPTTTAYQPNQIMWTQVINFQSLCLSKPELWNTLEIANPDILIAIKTFLKRSSRRQRSSGIYINMSPGETGVFSFVFPKYIILGHLFRNMHPSMYI